MKKLIIILITLLIIISGVSFYFYYQDLLKIKNAKIEEHTIKLGVLVKTNDDRVSVNNKDIYINKGGIYNIVGILVNGTIFVDTNEDVTLRFKDVTMVNESNTIIDNRMNGILNIEFLGENIFSDGSDSLGVIKSSRDININGKGKVTIYSNGFNGIYISNGSLKVEKSNVSIYAKNNVFNIKNNFYVNSGTLLGVGNGYMQVPSNKSKVNTIVLNFDEVINNGNINLVNSKNMSLIKFDSLKPFKIMLYSNYLLSKDSYNVLLDNKKVNISLGDTYKIDAKVNWFGKIDRMKNSNDDYIEYQ